MVNLSFMRYERYRGPNDTWCKLSDGLKSGLKGSYFVYNSCLWRASLREASSVEKDVELANLGFCQQNNTLTLRYFQAL